MGSSELLHEFFERQAQSRPRDVAVICGNEQMSYGELESRANKLARLLRSRGIGQESCVGLLLPRSIDLYVALLGILKAGAAYVPLDTQYPAERVSFILSDCDARALVTTRAIIERLDLRGADGSSRPLAGSGTSAGDEAVPAPLQFIALDAIGAELAQSSSNRLIPEDTGAGPDNLCYVIYTSGTTGRPKGVMIEHRSACHLVRAEAEIFKIQAADRVYQGFSIAFDASVEEIWLAFFAGATLVAASVEMARAGAGLSRLLTEAKVTVLSCVPTLLSMMEEEVPTLRLLILGGEVCPAELVSRWWKPNRKVVNTYGPTEATVIATYGECHPEKPVTIGRPLPNCTAMILDENQQPVADGRPGELCLAGIGLARGYVGRPELTKEKFIEVATTRFYRTGDLARWTADGELEFLGRADTQVKIRGFRVELSEIEAVLLDCAQIKAAAVALREDTPGIQRLVAYAVPHGAAAGPPNGAATERERPNETTRDGGPVLSLEPIWARLRARLPAYMVPSIIEALPDLPTLPSGKVDRKALPAPRSQPAPEQRRTVAPRTETEREIVAACEKFFAPRKVSIRDDFFLELGGHSLLAARLVSDLRKRPRFADLSVLDLYRHPTIESLAVEMDRRKKIPTPHSALRTPYSEKPSRSRHFFCGLAQFLSLFFTLSFAALQWLGPYIVYTVLIEEEYDFVTAVVGALGSLMALYPLMLAVPVAVKWLVIGRYKSGSYPLWGAYFFRWWFVTTLESAVPVGYLAGTPLLSIYLRLMGAKIGRNVHLDAESFAIYDLLSIGDDSSIGVDSNLSGYTIEDGALKLGTVTIGRRCFVGARASLRENTLMEDGSALEDLSLLPRGTTIPVGETWIGSPAQRSAELRFGANNGAGTASSPPATAVSTPEIPPSTPFYEPLQNLVGSGKAMASSPQPSPPEEEREKCPTFATQSTVHDPRARSNKVEPPHNPASHPSSARRFLFGLLHTLGLLTFPMLVAAALFPGIIVMNKLNYLDPYYWYLFVAPLVGLSFVVLLSLEIAAVKWLLLGRVKPGKWPVHSLFYFRKWFVDQMMSLSLDVLGPLYASVYLAPWYKLLGAKLGKRAEISTASFISPDLLSVGDESFIADNVSLGAPRVRDGLVSIGPNRLGKRSFIGNSALLPPGTVIGDSVLIGCLSVPPTNPADALREDTTWMGSPAIFLPQRQTSTEFPVETTFQPSLKLRIQRALIEFVRVISPSAFFIILISLLFSCLLLLRDRFSLLTTLLLFPLLYFITGLASAAIVIFAKWSLVGRYRAGEKPLWSLFVWRNELVNALHWHLAEPFLVGFLAGTPFISWYFRLLGTRIGRRVYLETADFSEFDLVKIGDECAINAECTIQTHLFEDRVMKISTVDIGPRCEIGASALVLYDTRMEEGAKLDALSLLMKGEVLPANTRWQGIPAQRVP